MATGRCFARCASEWPHLRKPDSNSMPSTYQTCSPFSVQPFPPRLFQGNAFVGWALEPSLSVFLSCLQFVPHFPIMYPFLAMFSRSPVFVSPSTPFTSFASFPARLPPIPPHLLHSLGFAYSVRCPIHSLPYVTLQGQRGQQGSKPSRCRDFYWSMGWFRQVRGG